MRWIIVKATRRLKLAARSLLILLAVGSAAPVQSAGSFAAIRAAWNRPAEPFEVIDGVYYVGTEELAAWLIPTAQGSVLIDGALEESAPLIEANIRRLGFKVEDVRFLLNSHAHFDHSGGLAQLKRDAKAQLIASRDDQVALETGRYVGNESEANLNFEPVKVDRVIADGEVLIVGSARLTAHLTPGHTSGCTTWTLPVVSHGQSLDVVFYCSTSVALNRLWPSEQYPGIIDDYRRSFARLATLQADVFLANHKDFFRLWEKRAAMRPEGPNPFIDAGELGRFVEASRVEFERDLAAQQASKKTAAP
jgi:metallo-beta-lactamase class B